jgi:hypothetical protein
MFHNQNDLFPESFASLRPLKVFGACLALATVPLASSALGQEEPTKESDPDPTQNISEGLSKDSQNEEEKRYPLYGEGKTLPANVMRVRFPFRYSSGDFGYDKDGKKQEQGLTVQSTASALVVEYGVTDDISASITVPYVLNNRLSLDGKKFRNSERYQLEYAKLRKSLASKLAESGSLCASLAACESSIDSGVLSLPQDFVVNLPSGETATLAAGVPLKSAIDSIILNAVKPAEGQNGLGDVELGILYSVFNKRSPLLEVPVYFALAGGFRIPTGKFKDVPTGQLPTGRGVPEWAFRTDFDYNPHPSLMFSYQHKATMAVAKGKKKKSSVLEGSKVNKADPTTAVAIANGSNGKPNEQTYERKGFRNEVLAKLAFAPGYFVEEANLFAPFASYKYNLDSQERLDGVAALGRPLTQSYSFGVLVDGLMYKFPAQAELEYEVPFSGKNRSLVTTSSAITLRGYLKF